MKSLYIIAFSFLLLGSTDPNSWQKPEYIEKAFIEIALKNEYQPSEMRVRKWVSPIRYQIIFLHLKPYPLVKNMVNVHMDQLMHITHHDISETFNKNSANLKIYITKDKYYKEVITKYAMSKQPNLSTESNCMATIHENKQHEIDGASVVIPIDHAMSKGLLPACIVEELTQVMGLPNDSDWVYPSIANDLSKIELLSGLDYILLKLLYSPELKPGMNLSDTKRNIKILIRKFQKQGLLKRATLKVQQEGLYRLLY